MSEHVNQNECVPKSINTLKSVTAKPNKMCKTGFMHIFTRVCIKSAYRMSMLLGKKKQNKKTEITEDKK